LVSFFPFFYLKQYTGRLKTGFGRFADPVFRRPLSLNFCFIHHQPIPQPSGDGCDFACQHTGFHACRVFDDIRRSAVQPYAGTSGLEWGNALREQAADAISLFVNQLLAAQNNSQQKNG